MAENQTGGGEDKTPREREAWRQLLARMAQLRGLEKVQKVLEVAPEGPSWDEVRGNLSFYAAMNLASRKITLDVQSPVYWQMRELWKRIDTNATLSLRASQDCSVGYVTLKLIGFMSLSVSAVLDELLKPQGVMIHETLRYLASTLDWHHVAAAGWPIFRLLSRLEYFAYLEMGSANPLNEQLKGTWSYETPYLDTVEQQLRANAPVPAAASSLVLSYGEFYSPLGRALALLSLADVLRPGRGMSNAQERLIRRAVYLLGDHFLHAKYPPFVALSSRWPIFQMADRLACEAQLRWTLPRHAVISRPWMALLPMAEKVSDVVRACRLPYCDLSFLELVLRSAAVFGGVQLLEVGANLGDCALWTAAHLGRRLHRAIAVEPLPEVAQSLQRSVQMNGWESKFQVIQAFAGARSGWGRMHFLGLADGNPYASATAVAPGGAASIPSVAARTVTVSHLSRLMEKRRSAKILKIYAYGDLRDVLLGARGALHRVDTLWLAFAAGQLKRARAAAVFLFAMLRHHFGCFALPAWQVDWCRCSSRFSAPRRMGQVLSRSKGAYSMVYVAAFKPRSLFCPPWRVVEDMGPHKVGTWDSRGVAKGCSFGRSRRQVLLGKRHGAGYESYFLGAEGMEMERLRKEKKSRSAWLEFFHDSGGTQTR
eukprot:s574_g37.t3